jgi:EmrB/QacA subfamily drug resistance transporter
VTADSIGGTGRDGASSGVTAGADGPQSVSGRRLWLIIGALLMGLLLAALDQTIVSTALPTIVGDLGGASHLSWVVTAYLLASTASTPLWGKLGDMYGRKVFFQGAIVIFLVGSVLSGLSSSMTELIAFRALQGIGGGGLMIGAQTIIGDVVPPRDRGRYQGLFGAVFGLSSVIGPLIGGLLVDNLSWHWIFYINLPIGVLALAVTAAVLPSRLSRVQHVIDYVGAVLVALAATSFVLLTSLGGTTYPWGSAEIVILGAAGVALTVAFVVVERRAAEPVIPLHLFANRVFAAASAIGFVVGFAMFGAITFLPLFLQIVKGVNPTVSGLRLLPLLGGLILTSTGSGQLISRYGRYKVFPIVGTALMTVGLYLLSRLGPSTSTALTSLYMFVFGVGLGGVMQVLVIAVQNAVDYKDLGAATSGATFFRSMGGSFGTAVFGAIFANLLTGNLAHYLKGVSLPPGLSGSSVSPAALAKLPPQAHAGYVQAYAHSLQTVFEVAVPIAFVAFLLTWLLPELKLRKTTEATHSGDVFALPTDRSSVKEMERALTVLARKENRPELFRRMAARAHIDLEPVLCWLLLCIDRHPDRTVAELACPPAIGAEIVQQQVHRLADQGLVVLHGDGGARDGLLPVLTPAGRDTVAKLIEARRQGLAELLDGWSPEDHHELVALLRRLGREMLDDRRPPQRERELAPAG